MGATPTKSENNETGAGRLGAARGVFKRKGNKKKRDAIGRKGGWSNSSIGVEYQDSRAAWARSQWERTFYW